MGPHLGSCYMELGLNPYLHIQHQLIQVFSLDAALIGLPSTSLLTRTTQVYVVPRRRKLGVQYSSRPVRTTDEHSGRAIRTEGCVRLLTQEAVSASWRDILPPEGGNGSETTPGNLETRRRVAKLHRSFSLTSMMRNLVRGV